MVVSMRQGEPPLQHIAVLGLDGGSMAKDVVTAQLDTVYMITAGSLKPRRRHASSRSSRSSRRAARRDSFPRSA